MGSVEDFTSGRLFGFNGTTKHVDGPNDFRDGYRHTFVYSFVVSWKNKVYRVSLICYTRQSAGDWVPRNSVNLALRNRLHDYRVEYNAFINYSDFHLLPDMSAYNGRKMSNSAYIIRPAEKYLTNDFYDRYARSRTTNEDKAFEKDQPKVKTKSMWKEVPSRDIKPLMWMENYKWSNQKLQGSIELKTGIIAASEFFSRYVKNKACCSTEHLGIVCALVVR